MVTLDAPERRNALDLTMCDEIVATLDALEAGGEVGAIVVTGAAPAFCAGADLSHLGASQREGLLHVYEGFLRIARSPLPTIAAVNGAAVGAGMNLALACDVRLAAPSAKFDTRFLQLGIHPGGGHTWMLRRAVGPQAAAAMVLFGEVLDGAAAERIGLVWRCVAGEELLATARELAAKPPRDRQNWSGGSRRRSPTWPRSTTTPRRWSESWIRRSGRSTSPSSRNGWPPFRPDHPPVIDGAASLGGTLGSHRSAATSSGFELLPECLNRIRDLL